MSIKHNYLSVISNDDMKKFIEESLKIDVELMKSVIDEDLGKMFVCISKQNLIEYTGEDSNWCVFDDLGMVGMIEKYKPYENNFKFAELKPHLFKEYVLFVAKQNMIDGEPIRIDGLSYGDKFIGTFAKNIESKPRSFLAELFFGKPTKKDKLVDLLVEIEQELNKLESNCDEPNL